MNKAATATTAAPTKLPPSLAPSPWLNVVVGAAGAIVEDAAPETVVKPPVEAGTGATLPGVVYRGAVRVVPGRMGLAKELELLAAAGALRMVSWMCRVGFGGWAYAEELAAAGAAELVGGAMVDGVGDGNKEVGIAVMGQI